MIGITVTEKGGPADTAREVTTAINAGLEGAVKYWHRNLVPGHFKQGAAHRYSYAPRTPAYCRRKGRVKGHQLPLVWSGTMRDQVLRRVDIKTMKTRASARGKVYANAFNFASRRRASGRPGPDLGAEVLATADGERNALAQLTERRATKHLNRIRTVRTRRIV